MRVKFNFDYVLNLHSRISYITAIERDGVDEDVAFKRSSVQVNRYDIKSITRTTEGAAVITTKKAGSPIITVEDYDEILDTMEKANLAIDIMHKEKVYIFDNFVVDDDELKVCDGWKELKAN